MSPDLDRALRTRYPSIFADCLEPVTRTAMGWGIDCHDGWYTLIDSLCAGLQGDSDSGNAPQVVATQVKEKYGGLRFYVHNASERQRAMIELTEYLSVRTCEICGAPGTRNHQGWVRTRCNDHQLDDSKP